MADCPGVLHLAEMADGGLARLRVPGGALTCAQMVAVADAAERFGSGEIDLTSRANLQIRGVASGAGAALAKLLSEAGFDVLGEADRRRNILLDPFTGLDPAETRDMRPLAKMLEAQLVAAPWIGRLSPKFSCALDGGGASGVASIPSDVAAFGKRTGIVVSASGQAAKTPGDASAAAAVIAIARAAVGEGDATRALELDASVLREALLSAQGAELVSPPTARALAPRLGAIPTPDGTFAVALPVPVGRLDTKMMRFVADAADRFGDGGARLAPWSAIVVAGVAEPDCGALLAQSVERGFTPVAIAERLVVVACAGAPACERAREPAKALGADVLRLANAEPAALPARTTRLHLSACPKGCAGSAPADLLLLGSSERPGWTAHRSAAPRAPGPASGRLDSPSAETILALLAR